MSDFPTLTSVSIGPRRTGLAGTYAYDVAAEYDTGEINRATFAGSIYGGPVYVNDVFIDTDVKHRCGGILTPDFIRAFYA